MIIWVDTDSTQAGLHTNFKLSASSEQVYLFNNAKIIIGPHGAAFTNLIFCKKNTKVIEIKPANRPNNFKEISKAHNLIYKQIVTPPIKKNKINGDIFLKPQQLSKLI